MGLQGILTLVVIGGLAAGAYYYRDGIKDAFASTQKSDEEKDYDFEKKKREDEQWQNAWYNPNNWLTSDTSLKSSPKQKSKHSTCDPNNDPSKFNPPNTKYNSNFPYGYADTSGGRQ